MQGRQPSTKHVQDFGYAAAAEATVGSTYRTITALHITSDSAAAFPPRPLTHYPTPHHQRPHCHTEMRRVIRGAGRPALLAGHLHLEVSIGRVLVAVHLHGGDVALLR